MNILNTLLCVPTRLNEDKNSSFYNYPYNIVLVRIALHQGSNAFYTFEYEPDTNTFKDGAMTYYNLHSRDYYLKYSYDPDTAKYQVAKYHKRQLKGRANGKGSWEIFFHQVSLIAPVAGEPCIIRKIGI